MHYCLFELLENLHKNHVTGTIYVELLIFVPSLTSEVISADLGHLHFLLNILTLTTKQKRINQQVNKELLSTFTFLYSIK